jgi:diguanylate cyclase (GGDEF)-like protein
MVGSSEVDAALLQGELRRYGYEPAFERVSTLAAMSAALNKQRWDVVIADYGLPGFTALAALALLKKSGLDVPFIIVSDASTENLAITTMQAGVRDVLSKDNLARLGPIIQRELHDAEWRHACQQAQDALRKAQDELEAKVALRTRALARANLQLKKTNAKLEKASREDPLTGLLNRRVLLEMATGEWARWLRYGTPFSLMLIDIDNFKSVNDRHGHLIGDRVLVLIANTIARSIRSVDMVGRYGGEEFVVVLPQTHSDGAVAAGHNLIHNIRRAYLRTDDLIIGITVSVGIATVSSDDENLDSLLQRADAALYAAKHQGKDRLVLGDQDFRTVPELFVESVR